MMSVEKMRLTKEEFRQYQRARPLETLKFFTIYPVITAVTKILARWKRSPKQDRRYSELLSDIARLSLQQAVTQKTLQILNERINSLMQLKDLPNSSDK